MNLTFVDVFCAPILFSCAHKSWVNNWFSFSNHLALRTASSSWFGVPSADDYPLGKQFGAHFTFHEISQGFQNPIFNCWWLMAAVDPRAAAVDPLHSSWTSSPLRSSSADESSLLVVTVWNPRCCV